MIKICMLFSQDWYLRKKANAHLQICLISEAITASWPMWTGNLSLFLESWYDIHQMVLY